MKLEWRHYTSDLFGIDTTGFVIPDGYDLHGVAYPKDFPNTCHHDKPILILKRSVAGKEKFFAQCACGLNLTTNGKDCGNDALTEFRNTSR